MRPKILYIEDDQNLAFLTKESLENRGYEVDHHHDPQEVIAHYSPGGYAVCIVDIVLENELDGFDIVREIRTQDKHTPILFLTAKVLSQDKIKGLKIGADDYILKPFSIEELDLRIQVFLRRSNVFAPADTQAPSIALGQYTFSPREFQLVHPDGQVRQLTKREQEVLYYLCQHLNTTIHREDILRSVWGKNDYFLGRSLDVFITKLRKYLSDDPSLEIKTVHGVGFHFHTPER